MVSGSVLRVSVRRNGGTATLRLVGELDLSSAGLLRGRLRDLLEPQRPDPVDALVVDLSQLLFLDVTGLSVLLDAERRLRARGGSVVLTGVRPIVRRVLQLLDLQHRLPEA